MKVNTCKIVRLLGLAAILMLLTQPGYSKPGKKKNKKNAPTEAPAPPNTKYEKLFKDKQVKTVDGVFKLHKVEEKLYMEIPVDLMGREFVINTIIEESSDHRYGMAGMMASKRMHVTFTREDSLVHMREVQPRVLAGGDRGMELALGKNNVNPIIRSFKIEAPSPDGMSVVIENTSFFTTDNKNLDPVTPNGFNSWVTTRSSFQSQGSYLADVGAGEGYVSVTSELNYVVNSIMLFVHVVKDRPVGLKVNRTISLLPRKMARERYHDPRVGVRAVPVRQFTDRGTRMEYYASRLNVDSLASGPVVFYVDPLFDDLWREGIAEGVNLWNGAFANAGYGQALRAEVMPQDADFDRCDPRKFYIIYGSSTTTEPVVATVTDPRSGEITGARITLPWGIRNAMRSRKFIDLSAVDPASREMTIADEDMIRVVKSLTARAVAECLGFEKNYSAAQAYPIDSLRSPSFTRRNGISASIIHPTMFNYVAQEEDARDGVLLINDVLGVLDHFNIEWLYGRVEGAETADDERAILRKKVSEKTADPIYFYGGFIYDNRFSDARPALTNLGNDPFERIDLRLSNLRYVMENASDWIEGNDPDLAYRKEVVDNILREVQQVIAYAGYYVGGTYYHETMEGDSGGLMLQAVPKEVQRRAVHTLLSIAQELSWLENEQMTQDLLMANPSRYVQEWIFSSLFNRAAKLDQYQKNLPGRYSTAEMIDDMMNIAYRTTRSGGKLNRYEMSLQSTLVNNAIGYSKAKEKPGSANGSATVFGISEYLFDHAWNEPFDVGDNSIYGDYTVRYGFPEFNEHIYFGVLRDMKNIYTNALTATADRPTRDFYRAMLFRINNALSVN